MATREEKIAFLQSQVAPQSDSGPSRAQKIAFLQAQSAPKPDASQGQTAIEGFGNGATLGYLPQLQALASKPIYGALNAITGQNVQPDSYVDERDQNIARQTKQANDNPITSGASQLAGGLTTGIATAGLMPTPAATIGGRIAQAGKVGVVLGGAANPGDTKGEINPAGGLPDRVINAGKGGALAALLGSLVETPNMARAAKNSVTGQLGKTADFTPIADKDAVVAAAKNLGIDSVPNAVLTDNPTYQKLESGLSQSGSYPAKGIRDQYTNFFKALDKASEKISSLKSTDSDFASGGKIQSDLAGQVNDSRAPVSEMYDELTPHLRKIEVNPTVVNKTFGALKRNPLFQTQDGVSMLADYQDAAKNVSDLASLKEWRSNLRDAVGPNASPLEAKRMDAIAKAVTSIRDNSINALKEHMPEGMHEGVDKLIDDVALADAAHSANLKDINSVKGIVGNKDFKSPTTFLNKLGDMRESDVAQKAANLDIGTMRNLQEKFPSVFEKAKTAKINDLIQNSTNPVSGFNDARFLKQYQGLDQEMKDLIFDPKIQSHIENLQTLKQAIPDKLGPSGTPEGKMLMDMFNPKRNALDYGVKKTLESASSGAPTAPAVPEPSRAANVLKFVASQSKAQAGVPNTTIQKSAEQSPPAKGQDKWANDGFQKLLDHTDDSDTKNSLQKNKGAMLSDPKLKDLLSAASDLKPGSKAMEKILSQIKSKIASGD